MTKPIARDVPRQIYLRLGPAGGYEPRAFRSVIEAVEDLVATDVAIYELKSVERFKKVVEEVK